MSKPPRFSAPKAISFLSSDAAPRVFRPSELVAALNAASIPVVSSVQLHRFLTSLQQLKLVNKIHHGVYLNNLSKPAVKLEEAAGHIRSGAVVSLQTVLGRWGVLNNPVPFITCVLPGNGNTANIQTSEGEIRFYSMREDLVSRPSDPQWNELTLVKGTTPVARPEKALLDWLWLSASPTSTLSPPPLHDIDLDELDPHALEVLASKMGLEERLNDFRSGRLASFNQIKKPALRR